MSTHVTNRVAALVPAVPIGRAVSFVTATVLKSFDS